MNYDQIIQILNNKIDDMKQSQRELHEELLSTEALLNKSLDNMKTLNIRLKDLVSKKSEKPEPSVEKEPVSGENFNVKIEKLLQGSVDALGDKISDKLLNMMKELKTLSGPMRVIKMKEIKETAGAELVDLSSLFVYEEVESNIEEIGVEEKEVKGIDKSLEKLRRMKKTDKM